ncbi:MAG TPA: outer membrane protein assembly factor BamD [Terriglobales bacterium]|nr:outer membrane protein assembly factor BamD [Terriglobales bacterium]
MFRRFLPVIAAAALLIGLAGCTNKRVKNPIANVNSKQPDKVLFDRAMDAMKHNHYDVARMTLQTLINTYPDSEFLARAKLAVGDSWYAEGGATALAQAESEYKDFITFFPNMPEAAEAQMRIGDIHYRQMEKADRDFTHAKRAEDEYRQMILQFPDSKLVPEAKQRLREVQEVLAEREFMIGRFYYLRESYAAAMARLQSLVDTYPLYSGADETLYMIGQIYERQLEAARANPKLGEVAKGGIIKNFTDKAAEAYDRILTRYPAEARAADARARLEALHRPVPKATPEAIAQNKKEQESRGESGMIGKFMLNFHRRPDVSEAASVGEPTLVDPKQLGAPEVAKQASEDMVRAAAEAMALSEKGKVSVETVKEGAPPPNQPIPRSDNQPAAPAGTATTPAQTAAPAAATPATTQPAAAPAANNTGIEELTPNLLPDGSGAPDAAGAPAAGSQAAPATPASDVAPPAPPQVNEIGDSGQQPAASSQADPKATSSSQPHKKKKKKSNDQQPH